MVDFYFNKGFFGVPSYLLCWEDGSIAHSPDKPHDGWLCINSDEAKTLSGLYGFKVPRFPSQKFQRFFDGSGSNNKHALPWHHIMPAHAYKSEIKKTVGQLKKVLSGLNLTYYKKHFVPQNEIFKELRPAKIDVALLLDLIAAHEDTQGHLRSFMPTAKGFARAPVYTRTETVTGRLKTKKGPMILNVKAEHRKVLTSRFPGGSVRQLDYSSLEPRVLLSVQDHDEVPEDIYQDVLDSYELEQVPRQAIKTAVLSRIYGATNFTIEKQIKHLVDYPEDIVRIVDEYFEIDGLREKLASEFSINAGRHVTNFYGRHILCEDTPLYVLLNYFIQSTGVDVCMHGFGQIVARLRKAEILDKIVPLFILHDALFLDVHPDFDYLLPKLCKAGSMDIPRFENTNFHLQVVKGI